MESDLQISPDLSSPPVDWFSAPRVYPFREVATINFMFHMFYSELLKASTISNYLAGVRHHLIGRNVAVDFLAASLVVSAKSALSLMCRQRVAVRETSALPFTRDLIERFVQSGSFDNPRHLGTVIALNLAHLLLLRVSEYVVTESNHYLRSNDVLFLCGGQYYPSHDVPEHLWDCIEGVIIDIRSAKNDSAGRGHRFFFRRRLNGFNCICSLLVRWSRIALLQPNQPFFTYRSLWRLGAQHISAAVKYTAAAAGLDYTRYSAHSLRYGGASALAAANMPTYVIQRLGRWKSLAFLQYIHFSKALLSKAQEVLTVRDLLTHHDVSRLHPGGLFPQRRG